MSGEEAKEMEKAIERVELARTYDEYVENKKKVLKHKDLIKAMGLNISDIKPEDEWKPEDLSGKYFFDPITIMEKVKIPVLVFFGERDTQVDPKQGMKAYRAALEKAGNTNFRIELVPGVDHCMIKAETGSLKEVFGRSNEERINYSERFLDMIEEWLDGLAHD